jgi:two-component system sensor histidine kinase DegS
MDRFRKIVSRRSFWILAAMLIALGLLHYLTPQMRFLPFASHPLGRHSVERIIFILPVAGATFAFGQAGGLVALALSVLIMLPRVFLLSPYPADALTETVAVGVVGYLVVWMIETQEREKRLRQAVASRLRTINAVTSIVTGSLELEHILNGALDKVLDVVKVKLAFVYLLEEGTQELVLTAYRGLSPDWARGVVRLKLGENLTGQVGQSGEPVVMDDLLEGSGPSMCLASSEGMRSFMAVPLKSGDSVLGVMALADSQPHLFTLEDVQLLTAIGSQVGVAVENARLYESMRFYARQITRAQEDERKRIARELHDETIQMLIVISRRLEALATLPKRLPKAAMQHLVGLQELVSDTLKGLRRFVQDLRPATLDHLGLMVALVGLINDLGEKDGIETEVRVKGEVRRLAPEQELGLFRIFQEALSNIRRHSRATQVVVEVTFHPNKINMRISDNGCGFDAPGRMETLVSTGKLGLIGMHERARLLGGTLEIQSEPGKGTTVIVDMPIQSSVRG